MIGFRDIAFAIVHSTYYSERQVTIVRSVSGELGLKWVITFLIVARAKEVKLSRKYFQRGNLKNEH